MKNKNIKISLTVLLSAMTLAGCTKTSSADLKNDYVDITNKTTAQIIKYDNYTQNSSSLEKSANSALSDVKKIRKQLGNKDSKKIKLIKNYTDSSINVLEDILNFYNGKSTVKQSNITDFIKNANKLKKTYYGKVKVNSSLDKVISNQDMLSKLTLKFDNVQGDIVTQENDGSFTISGITAPNAQVKLVNNYLTPANENYVAVVTADKEGKFSKKYDGQGLNFSDNAKIIITAKSGSLIGQTDELHIKKNDNYSSASGVAYDKSVSYDDLSKHADKYKGQGLQYSGKILQVISQKKATGLRLEVDDNQDHVIFVSVPTSVAKADTFKENATITIKGVGAGNLTYETTDNKKVTVPAIYTTEVK